jgi:hypothetical protein
MVDHSETHLHAELLSAFVVDTRSQPFWSLSTSILRVTRIQTITMDMVAWA